MSAEAWWIYGIMSAWLFFTGIGLPPAPEEAGIIGAGAWAAADDRLFWFLALPACLTGIIAADLMLYGIGFFGRRRLLESRLVKRFLPAERRGHIEEGFRRHGVKILITGRLLPGIRTGVFLVAGAVHFPMIRFLLADALFAIFGVSFFFFGSYLLVDQFKLFLDQLHQVQYWLLLLAIVAAVGYVLYRYVRFLKTRAATDDLSPPSLPELIHPSKPPEGKEQPTKEDKADARLAPSLDSTRGGQNP